MTSKSRMSIAAIAAFSMLGACSQGRPTAGAGTTTPRSFPPPISPYEQALEPADFVAGIDNPYMPLEPGTVLRYKGISDGETEIGIVTVTDETKEVMGVSTTVVKDVVEIDGKLAEKTFDWFAQDRYGNVWYFGEISREYEEGKFVGLEGSWEGGVDGALPGIVMLGDPQIGDRYRQEFYKGEAEDFGAVIELGASVKVPAGTYSDVLVTKDWNPLEPKVLEHKYYARGIGVVLERKVRGGQEKFELIEVTRTET